jgi:hypothetical protein
MMLSGFPDAKSVMEAFFLSQKNNVSALDFGLLRPEVYDDCGRGGCAVDSNNGQLYEIHAETNFLGMDQKIPPEILKG